MDDNFSTTGIARAETTSFDAGLRAHMVRVYNYMTGGLALTGVLAWIVANTALAGIIYGTPLRWVVIFAPIAIVLGMQFKMQSLSPTALRALFWSYCGTVGLSLGFVFLIYTNASVARAFFITAGTFGAMSLWGYTTKKDLTSMGGFLMMGVLGLIIAGLVNLFLMSPVIYWITSMMGVCIFVGLTAYDTQNIKEQYSANWGEDANSKLAVFGALRLYMDFINIFLNLLRLMGDRR